jgi:hypothetical protein
MKERIASQVTSVHNVVMLAGLLGLGLTGSMAVRPTATSDTLAQRAQTGAVAAAAQQVAGAAAQVGAAALQFGSAAVETAQKAAPAAIAVAPAAQAAKVVQDALAVRSAPEALPLNPKYADLREQVRWKPVRYGGDVLKTPDIPSRLLLAQSAASKAGLHEVGLSYRDVYGIINAETSWIPRMGASKNGTPNLGIAQFEPATAKGMGIVNPYDPVEAVHAAAQHMKTAAVWSAKRLEGMKLKPDEHARKLREGVSIYYNLSWKGRNQWNGKNTAKLPIETRRHIANARLGAREAAELEAELRQVRERMDGGRFMTASYQQK